MGILDNDNSVMRHRRDWKHGGHNVTSNDRCDVPTAALPIQEEEEEEEERVEKG